MSDSAAAPPQSCPACGTLVDTHEAEPLALVPCPHCGEKLRVERAFDQFTLVETLGMGGMGAVYKARDTRLDRFVALKLLRKELSANPAEAAQLQQEARVTASVNHPHVIQVYTTGSAHGQLYLVMELVDHGSLDDLMAQHGRLGEVQVLQAGIQVAKGLQAAQQKGLIHRDVKPANILFADAETAKIGDFGLAVAAGQKAEAQNEIWGTPYYVAPERLNNAPEDFRSDIYSLGATLFHALAGRPPMEGESTSATELRKLKSHPPDLHTVAPEVSRETARIINKMLAPEPANRFTSYAHLITQLQRALGSNESTAASSRVPWKSIAAAAALLALLAGGFYFVKRGKAPTAPAVAATPAASSTPDNTLVLQKRYEEARRQLLDGKYDAASTAFTRLIPDAADRQPLLNWTRLHAGLASLLQGKTAPARDMFQQVERGGPYSNAKGDAELASFFVATAHLLAAPGPVRPEAVAELNTTSVDAFSLFLVGCKNWQLSSYADAAALLNKFNSSEPAAAWAWVNDYKPIARKFFDDHRTYEQWKQLPQSFASAAEIRTTLEKSRALEKKLQMRGALADELSGVSKRLATELTRREKEEKEARAQEKTKLLALESPLWDSAMAAAKQHLDALDFADAFTVIDTVKLSEPSLLERQVAERKKMRWLADWKARLVADLKTGRYIANIADIPGVDYAGVVSANEAEITLRIPGNKGSAPVKWTQLTPQTLLAMSKAFINLAAPDAADRQWTSAVFAQTTAQSEAAAPLAEAAAAAKPAYRAEMRALFAEP